MYVQFKEKDTNATIPEVTENVSASDARTDKNEFPELEHNIVQVSKYY
jgi:hypothetical protein